MIVALMLSGRAGQAKLEGLFRYLREGRQWDVDILRTTNLITPGMVASLAARGVSGIVLSQSVSPEVAESLVASSVPLVAVDMLESPRLWDRRSNIAFVTNDSTAIGEEAASHLLAQGVCRGFGYVGPTQRFAWSRNRFEGFRHVLERNGFACETFDESRCANALHLQEDDAGLLAWLRHLPRPAGVLVSHDDPARHVVEVAEAGGLRIPEDVAILGVNNDAVCETVFPAISSVEPDFDACGRQAGAFLDVLMAGPHSEPLSATYGVARIVARETTQGASSAGRLVQRAMAYILANACNGIGVPDVVAHLRVSRRLAACRT